METKPKNRAWVKDAAIVFLVVLLLLTFFSNTIMNHSLPEVATQMVTDGTITAKVRGTGTVAANGSHKVKAKANETIGRVMVKAGQEVSAGDVLFVLGPGDSDQLEEAKAALDDLQTQYAQAALSVPLAKNFTDEQIALRKASDALTAAKEELKQAEKDMTGAGNDENAQRVAELLKEKEKTETNLATKTAELDALKLHLESTKQALDAAKKAYSDIRAQYLFPTPTSTPNPDTPAKDDSDKGDQGDQNNQGNQNNQGGQEEQSGQGEQSNSENTASQSLTEAVANTLARTFAVVGTQSNDSDYPDSVPEVAAAKKKMNDLETQYTKEVEANSGKISSLQYDVDTLTMKLEALNKELAVWSGDAAGLANLKAKEKAYQDALDEYNLKMDALNYAAATQERSIASASAGLGSISNKIKRQQEKIKQLTGEGDENTVTANVSGTVTEVNCTAGDAVLKDDILCAIEVPDMGYTVSFSVTNDQAKRLHVGDTATISNYYWGNQIVATLSTIQTDKKNPMSNKLLTFDLDGDVTSGSEITVSVGQKSARYDLIIPNSAIRTDSNGSFVLAVMAKSSPLGNRYVAKRVAIEVLAADDTNSAVTADLSNGDYVITTSSAPIANGDMVRMADAQS